MHVLRVLVRIRLCLLFCSTAFLQTDLCVADWQYVATSDEVGFLRPLFRSILLSTEPLKDIEEQVTYRGTTQRYALLRYGTPNSQRVAIVLDEVSSSDFDLYVDADRDRTIVTKEKVGGLGRLRQLELDAELSQGDGGSDMLSRHVVIRRGITSTSLAFATLGYVEGNVELDGMRLRARRVDGDGDGLFSSARDRVWLDLDGNSEWDAFAEQFPYLPILKLSGERYGLRGDLAGKRLDLRELSGTGTVRLAMKLYDPKARVVMLDVMLVGTDGSAVSLQGTQEAVTVPTGKYTVNTVRLVVKDGTTNTPWEFVFSDTGKQNTARSFNVSTGREVTLDPIGQLRFELNSDNGKQPVKPGTGLSVNLRLYTEDGLLINSSNCGTAAASFVNDSNFASISLRSASGLWLSSTHSGFT